MITKNGVMKIKPVTKERLSKMKEEPSVDETARRFIEENNLVWNPKTMSYDCEDNVEVSEDIVAGEKLKIRFGKVGRNFDCGRKNLVTLEGAPREVVGNFDCRYNKLATLEGAPRKVGGNFDCGHNELTTLEGAPNEVGGDFLCFHNELTTLEGAPQKVGRTFDCSYNKLTTLEGAPNEVGGGFFLQ